MRKITVLIIDDEITVLQGLKNLFDWEKNGYAILGEAMDGISALNFTFEIRPDIVLMDINMPLMSGLDVVSRIRESLPQTVLDAQSVDVDAVSGATTTSKAFFAAVTEALGQAS